MGMRNARTVSKITGEGSIVLDAKSNAWQFSYENWHPANPAYHQLSPEKIEELGPFVVVRDTTNSR